MVIFTIKLWDDKLAESKKCHLYFQGFPLHAQHYNFAKFYIFLAEHIAKYYYTIILFFSVTGSLENACSANKGSLPISQILMWKKNIQKIKHFNLFAS